MTAEYVPAFAQALMAIIAASLLYASIVYWKRLRATALILSGTWYVVWILLVFPVGVQELITKLGWFQ
jgi:hypothetical protein